MRPSSWSNYYDYYGTPRGYHPRAVNSGNAWTQNHTAVLHEYADSKLHQNRAAPSPLFIHGENAHSRYFSETAYAAAAEPKELMIIKGASHIDLYDDKAGKIPYDKMVDFFTKNLK